MLVVKQVNTSCQTEITSCTPEIEGVLSTSLTCYPFILCGALCLWNLDSEACFGACGSLFAMHKDICTRPIPKELCLRHASSIASCALEGESVQPFRLELVCRL